MPELKLYIRYGLYTVLTCYLSNFVSVFFSTFHNSSFAHASKIRCTWAPVHLFTFGQQPVLLDENDITLEYV